MCVWEQREAEGSLQSQRMRWCYSNVRMCRLVALLCVSHTQINESGKGKIRRTHRAPVRKWQRLPHSFCLATAGCESHLTETQAGLAPMLCEFMIQREEPHERHIMRDRGSEMHRLWNERQRLSDVVREWLNISDWRNGRRSRGSGSFCATNMSCNWIFKVFCTCKLNKEVNKPTLQGFWPTGFLWCKEGRLRLEERWRSEVLWVSFPEQTLIRHLKLSSQLKSHKNKWSQSDVDTDHSMRKKYIIYRFWTIAIINIHSFLLKTPWRTDESHIVIDAYYWENNK